MLNRSRQCGLALLALVIASAFGICGCDRNLFVDSDPSTTAKLRYWEHDSATETTASRRKGSDMGLGMPGMGGEQ